VIGVGAYLLFLTKDPSFWAPIILVRAPGLEPGCCLYWREQAIIACILCLPFHHARNLVGVQESNLHVEGHD
jgi:hypothetical protein